MASGGEIKQELSHKTRKSVECSAATEPFNSDTKEDASRGEDEVEIKLLTSGQLHISGEEAFSKIQNGRDDSDINSPVVISAESNNGRVCLPSTLGVSCSTPGDRKCLDPNAPEFTPSPSASPCLYLQGIFSPPVSPHHLYGQIAAIHLNGEMQQQQALSWYGGHNCPSPTTVAHYMPRTPCDHGPFPNGKASSPTGNLCPRRIRGGILTSNSSTRLTIDVSHIYDGFDNGAGAGDLRNFTCTTGLTPRSSPKDLGTHYIFDQKAAELNHGIPRTTLMVRNIPNKYRQADLITLLDEHCLQQNSQIHDSNKVESAYDFVYLPIDFKNLCNLGYGFVNFTSVEGTVRFYKARHFQKWERFNSAKICEIKYARLQGFAALKEHFRNSVFPCNTADEYLPAEFVPPRDGIQCTPPVVVAGHWGGKRGIGSNSTLIMESHNISRSYENGSNTNNVSILDNNKLLATQSYETSLM